MGRGLAALLTPSTTQGGPGDRDLRQLPVELISPNPRQPRRDFDEESLIALEVFGRRPDYDPRLDSIVRTEAARLRARLAEYYAGAGRRLCRA
jgi:hypothetical protein